MKNYMKIDQTLHSENEISEENMDLFIDKFCELCDEFGYKTAGGFKLVTEKELLEEE